MLKQLLFPGLMLMSRLNFATKFIFISLMFFVPMSWLSYTVIAEDYNKIRITLDQKEGVEALGHIQHLIQIAEKFRDIKLIAAYQPQSEYNTVAKVYSKKFNEALDKLKNEKYSFSEDATYQKLLNDLKTDANKAISLKVSSEASLSGTLGLLNKMVNTANTLLKSTVELSQLSLDSNAKTKTLIDLSNREVKPVSLLLGKVRAIGSYALTKQFLNSTVADDLDSISGKLYEVEPLLKNRLGLMIPNSQNQVKTLGDDFLVGIRKSLDSLDTNIMTVTEMKTPWKSFFDEISKNIDIQYTISDRVYKVVDDSLSVRLTTQEKRLTLVSTLIAVVILIIIYLYSALYLSLDTSIQKLLEATDKMAEGDMRVEMSVATSDELGHLTERFNVSAKRVRELIQQVSQTSNSVNAQSSEVGRINEVTSHAIRRQLEETEQAASAMTEMTANFAEVSEFSSQAETSANEASNEANIGRERVQDTLKNINGLATEIGNSTQVVDQLAHDSANIVQVLDQIKGIAEQTNLLALNAAIEAARAGEHGRGFAVVADEVRGLSQRTQKSTEEIEEMIAKIQGGVKNAVSAMANSQKMAESTVTESHQVEDALESIHEKVSTIVAMNAQIAEAVKQQAATAEDIDRNIAGISEVAEENVSNSNETTQASQKMSAMADELQNMLSSFKV